MAQQVKQVLAAKSNNLSLIPGTHTVERTDSWSFTLHNDNKKFLKTLTTTTKPNSKGGLLPPFLGPIPSTLVFLTVTRETRKGSPGTRRQVGAVGVAHPTDPPFALNPHAH